MTARGVALLTAVMLVGRALAAVTAPDDPSAARLYHEHCASCHGADRLGGMGPALLPENLDRLKKAEALEVVLHGRAASQMPGFAGKLTRRQAEALVAYLYTRRSPRCRSGTRRRCAKATWSIARPAACPIAPGSRPIRSTFSWSWSSATTT